MIVFLVSILFHLSSFTCSLYTTFLTYMSLILFRTSYVSFIRESFNSHNSAFNEEIDSWKEFEKEVVCLIFVSGVRMPFNNSGESGKVSLPLASGVLVAFSICDRSGKVWSDDVCDVWSTLNILKASRSWVAFFIYQYVLFNKPFN